MNISHYSSFKRVAACLVLACALTGSVLAQSATSTLLTSSLNPASEGEAITFTATVTGTSPTGTVTFQNGSTNLGTATLSTNGIAVFLASGGAGTYSIKAIYSGDSNNLTSTSSAITQVITNYSGSGPVTAAMMQEGMDYPTNNGTSVPPGRGSWVVSSSTTSAVSILPGDLSGATTPDILGLPNVTNPEAHLRLNLSGAAARQYYRPITTPVTVGSVYYSMLMCVTSNYSVATTNEFIFTMLASTATNAPAYTDPLSLHMQIGQDASHYQLGIQRLNGNIAWATNQLAAPITTINNSNVYLVVLKYTFGGNCALYINPTPGQGEPVPSAVAFGGGTAEPANIGNIMFSESGNTRGTNHYDVLRADTNWYNVTPSSLGLPPIATKLAITSSAQTLNAGQKSSLITVTLKDQSGNPLTNATSPTVVSLSSSSISGTFISGADGVTTITNLTIAAGSSTGTFYYEDSSAGSPTIACSSGFLTTGTQTETVNASGCIPPTAFNMTGGGAYCSTGTGAGVGLSGSQTGVSYQLYSNSIALGSPVSGTGTALSFGNLLSGTYIVSGYVTANPSCSQSMNGSAVVTENYPAIVGANPVNQSVYGGQSASFTSSASNTTSPTFQWQVSSNGGSAWANVTGGSGGTTASYSTGAVTTSYNGDLYQCVISGSGACGVTTATSTPASLSVTLAPTTNTLASSANPAEAGQSITFTSTVTSPGVQPSGTVTFKTSSAVLGSATLSGGVATLTTSGGVGTNNITAVYSGDSNNQPSTSAALTQAIQTPAGIASPAQMQDGQDYPLATSTAAAGRSPWAVDENGAATSASTSYIGIYSGDLSGATSPDIQPLPNTDTNVEAHLQVATAGATGRFYYRSIGTAATSNAIYYSFLMNVTVNPTGTNEFRVSMLASTASNNPTPTDPLTMHIRVGSDSTHYNLGIERLNGAVGWAANSLVDVTNYLVVLKYQFGPNSSNSLYINPIPGLGEPAPSASAVSDGVMAEPANIGNIGFWESFSDVPPTTGTLSFDVLRVDPSWINVTPPAGATGVGLTSIGFLSAPQTFTVSNNSPLMTIALEDQSNHLFTATSPVVVNLSTSSGGGAFVSAADGVTIITNVTVPAGSNTASFYYRDIIAGFPTLTASSGLLSSATQTETVNPPAGALDHFTVIPSSYTEIAGTPFTATVQAYDSNNVAIMNHSLDGIIVTMTSSGLAQFDGSGNGSYSDNTGTLTNGALTIAVRDPKAESVTLTAAVGTIHGTSSAISVGPGSAAQLQVLLPGESAAPGTVNGKTGTPSAEVSGSMFSIVVNEVDTNWNLVSSTDTVQITGGDPRVTLPPNTALSGGTVTLPVTDALAGSGYTLSAGDVSNGSITSNTSSAYSVISGPVAHIVLLAPGETATANTAPGKTGTTTAQTEGVGYTVTVDAFDANYNLVANSSDSVSFGSSDSLASFPASVTLVNGTKAVTITDYTNGTATLTATDTTTLGATAGSTTVTINPVPVYRSVQSGSWESTATWQTSFDGVTWSPASATPSALNALAVLVTNGYTVTVNGTEFVRQTVVTSNSALVVASAGSFTATNGFGPGLSVYGSVNNAGIVTNSPGASINFQAGSTYVHDQNSGTIVNATWDPNSTCEVTGWTTTTAVTAATGLKQKFGNFTWNCPSQSVQVSWGGSAPTNFSGNFNVISTGTGELAICEAATVNLTIGGSMIVSGGTLYGGTTGAGTESVVIDGDLDVSNGTLELEGSATGTEIVVWNLAGNLNITGGTLGALSTNSHATLNFVKGGTQRLTVSSPGTIASANYINWNVTNSSTLDLGTIALPGNGLFSVAPGAGLISANATGFAGNLRMSTNNIALSTAANYTYDGSVAQSDSLLPATVSGLTVNNASGVTLSQPETATNTALTGKLTVPGAGLAVEGAFTATAPSTVSGNVVMNNSAFTLIAGTNNLPGLAVQNGAITFASGPATLTLQGSPLPQGTYPLVTGAAGTEIGLVTVNGAGLQPGLQAQSLLSGSTLSLYVPGFYPIQSAQADFFSGADLILTNVSGLKLVCWSSAGLSASVTNWYLEGAFQEQPLGSSGYSKYAINVNPSTSPTYYMAGTTNVGPYISPVSVAEVTTPDFQNFTLTSLTAGINAAGYLSFAPPTLGSTGAAFSAGSGFQFQFSGASGEGYSIHASTDLVHWTVIATGTFGSSPVTFTDSSATNYPHRYYQISTP